METLIYIILGGILVRLDGWGPETEAIAAAWPKWKLAVTKFFNVWTCGLTFALMTLAYAGSPLTALVAGLAFVAWRLPGFNGWEKWWEMFWRGAWTSAIGFTALSFTVHHHPYYGWLFIPMGIAEMVTYSGSYKWLPGRVPQWAVHVTAEITSGLAFTALVRFIVVGP